MNCCDVMSRLSFSEEEGYWKGDEKRYEEGETESEKGVVWEELEMDFYFIHRIQIATAKYIQPSE